MKRLFALAVIFLATISQAQAAMVIWRGSFYISGKSGTCTAYDPTGDTYNVRFVPRNVGTNGPDSRFSLFKDFYAQSFRLVNGSFSSTAKTVQFASIWDSVGSPGFSVKVQFNTQSPTTIAATTNFIHVQGVITNYDWMLGCSVNFRMSLNLAR